MTRYRKKPVEVEAWQVGSDEPMPEWIISAEKKPRRKTWEIKCADSPFSSLLPHDGDYIVKDGGFYYIQDACSFGIAYEVVE